MYLPPDDTIQQQQYSMPEALKAGIPVHGIFADAVQKESSNLRELKAVSVAIRSLGHLLQHKKTMLRLDNMGAVKALGGFIPSQPDIIFGGSNNEEIQREVIAIHNEALQYNIDIRPMWIPRSQNQIADYLSKVHLSEHYCFYLIPSIVRRLDEIFGIHTIDRFASEHNVVVTSRRYKSKFFEPNAEWIDAFSSDWNYTPDGKRENNWIHPPWTLIGNALQHIVRYPATIIFPEWPSAHWWPLVMPYLESHRTQYLGYSLDILQYPDEDWFRYQHLPKAHLYALRLEHTDN